jgi:hypothetical protein
MLCDAWSREAPCRRADSFTRQRSQVRYLSRPPSLSAGQGPLPDPHLNRDRSTSAHRAADGQHPRQATRGGLRKVCVEKLSFGVIGMVDAGLQRVEDASSSQVVLVQAGPGPVIRGEHQAGKDYVCVWCGRRTLIERGVLSGLWDLVIECGACHRRSATPQLPPGMPLGTPLVMLTVGTYDIKEPVIQNVGAVVASQLAMDRYQAETGRWVNESDSPVVLDADLCEGLLTEIEDLFPDLIVALRPSHRRGRASATPPREPHRLLQLMDQVEGSARSLREDNFPQVNIAALVELRMAIGLSKRWRRNPAWDTLVQAIRSPTDYPHTIVTLAVAGALADWGNGVGLQEGEPSKRSADLRLAIGALGRFDIEVKTPLMLQDPHDALILQPQLS